MTEADITQAILGFKVVFSKTPTEITMHPYEFRELTGQVPGPDSQLMGLKVCFDTEFPMEQVVVWG